MDGIEHQLQCLNQTMVTIAVSLAKLAESIEVLKDQEDQYLETTECTTQS